MWVKGAKKKKDVLTGDRAQSFAFCMHERESKKQFHGVLVKDKKAPFLQKAGATLSSPVGASSEIRPTTQGSAAHKVQGTENIRSINACRSAFERGLPTGSSPNDTVFLSLSLSRFLPSTKNSTSFILRSNEWTWRMLCQAMQN